MCVVKTFNYLWDLNITDYEYSDHILPYNTWSVWWKQILGCRSVVKYIFSTYCYIVCVKFYRLGVNSQGSFSFVYG